MDDSSVSCSLVASARAVINNDKEMLDPVAKCTHSTEGFGGLARIWHIALASALFHVLMTCEIHIFMPYLYTRVRCCDARSSDLRGSYNVSKPSLVNAILLEGKKEGLTVDLWMDERNTTVIPACNIPQFPPHSRLWSLSPSCSNKAYVEDSAQHLLAYGKILQKVGGLFVLPVGGAIADAIGRRPVLAAYAFCVASSALIFVFDSVMHAGDIIVVTGVLVMCVLYQPQMAILSACVADVMGCQESSKSAAFASMLVVNLTMETVCNICLYFFLKLHLSSYTLPWAVIVILPVVLLFAVYFLMPETLSPKLRGSLSLSMLNPCKMQLYAVQLVLRDPVLVRLLVTAFFFWIYFLGFQTIRVSYLIAIGFTMEGTILPEILGDIAQVAFASALVKVLPRMGALRTHTLGHALFVSAYILWGPLTLVMGTVGVYIACVMQAAAFVCMFPSWQTIISQRVQEQHQAKCQSAVLGLSTIGVILGVPLYNRVLFTATANGIMQALPAIVSMFLAFACCILSKQIEALAKVVPPPAKLDLSNSGSVSVQMIESQGDLDPQSGLMSECEDCM